MNGGYVLLDLTKYGLINFGDETQFVLNNDDFNKLVNTHDKPVLVKYYEEVSINKVYLTNYFHRFVNDDQIILGVYEDGEWHNIYIETSDKSVICKID